MTERTTLTRVKREQTIAQAQAEARAPYAAKIRKMDAAIRALLTCVERERMCLLSSYCQIDAESLEPILTTLDDEAAEPLAEFDEAIRLALEALR